MALPAKPPAKPASEWGPTPPAGWGPDSAADTLEILTGLPIKSGGSVGSWELYTLSNGGFYMAPDIAQTWEVSCPNYYAGTLSSDALGIVACLCAYSHLSFRINERSLLSPQTTGMEKNFSATHKV